MRALFKRISQGVVERAPSIPGARCAHISPGTIGKNHTAPPLKLVPSGSSIPTPSRMAAPALDRFSTKRRLFGSG